MNKIKFALAGRIISKSSDARKIETDAIKNKRDWIVLQARNVAIILKRAGQ